MPFRGSFEYSLDDRGRVAIPAKYRAEFPNNLAVITPSPEGCLRVFPEAAFQEMSEDLASVSATTVAGRRLRRTFDARAFDAELDRQVMEGLVQEDGDVQQGVSGGDCNHPLTPHASALRAIPLLPAQVPAPMLPGSIAPGTRGCPRLPPSPQGRRAPVAWPG